MGSPFEPINTFKTIDQNLKYYYELRFNDTFKNYRLICFVTMPISRQFYYAHVRQVKITKMCMECSIMHTMYTQTPHSKVISWILRRYFSNYLLKAW